MCLCNIALNRYVRAKIEIWELMGNFKSLFGLLLIQTIAATENGTIEAGLPDFSWYKIPKRGKIYQITTNYTKYL
jgi:hypothetical protein